MPLVVNNRVHVQFGVANFDVRIAVIPSDFDNLEVNVDGKFYKLQIPPMGSSPSWTELRQLIEQRLGASLQPDDRIFIRQMWTTMESVVNQLEQDAHA